MTKKVFISHQKEDRDDCIKIAQYLKSEGLNVYFDEFDKELQIAANNKDSKGIVKAIKNGINQSTHMLCVISPKTLYSKWVPFEVGYGYDKTNLLTLTLKGIKDSDLPDYIRVAPIIRITSDLDKFAGISQHITKNANEGWAYSLFNFTDLSHPLDNVMDSTITG